MSVIGWTKGQQPITGPKVRFQSSNLSETDIQSHAETYENK